jgi:hypothetical protein
MSNEPTTPLVSLIVVTYNSAALLRDFFAALATTTYAPYEVLVVDNTSQDGTPHSTSGSSCTGKTPSCAGAPGCWAGAC